MIKNIRDRNIVSEIIFTASRSSGAGGQNVNKVNTKIELRFNINNSLLLTEEEKNLITEKLKNYITSDGFLVIQSQSERSQIRNKEIAIEKFYTLLQKAFTPLKKRIATNPTITSSEKRLDLKRKKSIIKSLRQKKFISE